MKKASAADKAESKKVVARPVVLDDCEALTAVERLTSIVNGPLHVGPPDSNWNFAVENEAQGTTEIAGQLEALRAEISVLESIMRPHMPDHLYDDREDDDGVKEGFEGYDPANSRARTPAVTALCEIANTVQSLRRAVRVITSHVVV